MTLGRTRWAFIGTAGLDTGITNGMKVAAMLDGWDERFPGCEPVAHRMRVAFPDRWVRFHALPGSKRYPETGAEYATVLARYDRILGELVGPAGPVVLVTTAYAADATAGSREPELHTLDPGAIPWRTVAGYGADDPYAEAATWRVFASPRDWRPGVLDPVFRQVADGEVANVLVLHPGCRWVFHPYDGGADVIGDTVATRDRLRAAFRGWLSPRPDGL